MTNSFVNEGMTRREFARRAIAAGVVLGTQQGVLAADMKNDIPYRTLGRTKEKISAIGLGGYHIGVPEEAEGLRIIRRAIDEGITFMDNCWDYHNGNSEVRMGKALRDG